MSDALHGIEEDVPFDHGTCDALQAWCTTVAGTIDGDIARRASAVTTGSLDFRGHFSDLFRDNADVARADATELAGRLRELARLAGYLQQSAHREQARREQARAWMKEREDRSWVHEKWDDLTESESDATPPVGPPDPPAPQSANLSLRGGRLTPRPGGGGGGGSTSSARPDRLRSFARTTTSLNGELAGKPGQLAGRLADFAALCRWGTLDGSTVVSGFQRWNAANEEDARWAEVVAAAFEKAGGTGPVSTVSNSALAAALRAAGVDATRDDITIDPAIAVGHAPTTGYAVDPVNTATGNFLETEVDLGFNDSARGLTWARTYNSFDTGTGGFGPGWSSWTECGLAFDDEAARARLEDGRAIVFPRQGDGWGRAVGENRWLDRTPGGYRVHDNTGRTWDYTPDGRLHATGTGTGNRTTYHHDDAGRLVRVTHARGRSLDLVWDGDRVVAVRASDGREATYDYDEHGQLVSTDTDQGVRSYGWTADGVIGRVTDADGVVELVNDYDERRRVTRQRTRHGRVVRFSYLDHRITVVADEDGGRSNTWLHDARGRLVGVVDSDEQRQSMAYDQWGNLVMVTERNGDVTVHEHDDRGRRVRTVTPSGADVTYGYDDRDRVTTVVTESGAVTGYAYEGTDRNPSLMTDPEGGRTHLSWTDDLLTRLTDPTGVTVTMAYDAHGDLVSTTDALGNTARLERDPVGRITAATSPGGHRTTCTYDDHGHLASRRDPDGQVWRFEHTRAGRLSAFVDPTGARTTTDHGDHGDEVRTTDPLGRTVERVLDDLGNLASARLPDGSTWQFTHDAMSRLTQAVDPVGGTWQYEHDRNGELVATVDPAGVRRSFDTLRSARTVSVDDGLLSATSHFDPLGRLTASTQPDGSVALASYDRCGRPVELVDPDGGLTRIVRDPAGRPVERTSPGGATTRFEYDACGRLAAVVDPLGQRSTRDYDADGRLVRQTTPTGEVARAEYDACGRLTLLLQPGRGVARYAYDAAGRVRESSDTWYGRRRFRYDAAGQLVDVVNGVGGVTRFTYDDNGRCVATTDPLGGTTRREFDGLDRCVRATDALGRTSRAGYDSSGRLQWGIDASGRRTEWTYDASGRWRTRSVDGQLRASVEWDVAGRTVSLTDHTSTTGPVVHELEWDRRQLVVRRSRGDRSTTWEHDADGRRTAMVTPDGVRTSYTHDAAGRLTAVDHPLLGRATFGHDATGRLVRSDAGDVTQAWEHRDGWVAAHTVTDRHGGRTTTVDRDADGRATAVRQGDRRTTYTHDDAGQLTSATTGDRTTSWRYDRAGRLVAETVGDKEHTHDHDAAGQLLVSHGPDGRSTRHYYDDDGRRLRTQAPDGTVRGYSWTPEGRLAGITVRTATGMHSTRLHVDDTGELATVDGVEVWWDAAGATRRPSLVDDQPVLAAGPVTGAGGGWTTPGWRSARGTGDDPWSLDGLLPLPGGLSLGASGELVVAGLEWMGARAYDPATRGFLSCDPLPSVVGTGWAANPYAYAGNDPLHALDPLGLRPATDADLQAFAAAHAGPLAGAWEFAKNNWEYAAGGLMVAAGVAAFFVPLPGMQIVGGALIGAGAETISQKLVNGSVDWTAVAVSGAAGALGGWGAGAILGRAASSSWTVAQRVAGNRFALASAGGALEGAAEGAVKTPYSFFTGGQPHTVGNFLRTAGSEIGTSTVTGALTGPLGEWADRASLQRFLNRGLVEHTVPDQGIDDTARMLMNRPGDTPVLGNADDTAVTRPWDGHLPLSNSGSPATEAAVRQAVDYQRPVYLASDPSPEFSGNLDILRDAGYTRQGDYMVPPGP